jgi:hypothetical protein
MVYKHLAHQYHRDETAREFETAGEGRGGEGKPRENSSAAELFVEFFH